MNKVFWHFSRRSQMMKGSIIRETLKITKKPGIISFGGGLPATESFPIEELVEASEKVLREKSEHSLQYGTTEGYPPLREFIADFLGRRGIKAKTDEIMITGGSQQGLDLVGRLFFDWGDSVIMPRPTYLGAIQAFNAYDTHKIGLRSDDSGITVDTMEEEILTNNPRLIYLVPTFQNPDGRTIPEERRQKIIELSRKYGVPILEDDPYSEINFQERITPAMRAMAPDQVILLGTFSKLLCPGFRIAWICAPKEVLDRIVLLKQGADLFTNTFGQHVIYEYAKDGALDGHIEKLKVMYKSRRDKMIQSMMDYFPQDVKFTRPAGGLFLWVELPENINTTELLPKAVEKNVAYIPGNAFYPNPGGYNCMRLNYSMPNEDQIEEGIKLLAELFIETLDKQGK